MSKSCFRCYFFLTTPALSAKVQVPSIWNHDICHSEMKLMHIPAVRSTLSSFMKTWVNRDQKDSSTWLGGKKCIVPSCHPPSGVTHTQCVLLFCVALLPSTVHRANCRGTLGQPYASCVSETSNQRKNRHNDLVTHDTYCWVNNTNSCLFIFHSVLFSDLRFFSFSEVSFCLCP